MLFENNTAILSLLYYVNSNTGTCGAKCWGYVENVWVIIITTM